jgi:hypothetical protein
MIAEEHPSTLCVLAQAINRHFSSRSCSAHAIKSLTFCNARQLEAGLNSEQTLLTPQELAQRLQVTPSWVYRNAHKLGVYHLGKYLRFSWARVLEALESVNLPRT